MAWLPLTGVVSSIEGKRRSGRRGPGAHLHSRTGRRPRPARTIGSTPRSSRQRADRARGGGGRLKAPDYAEPIIAWRAWLIVAEDEEIRLSSVLYRNSWPPHHELEAECHRRVFSFPRFWQKKPSGHSAPTEKCRCGIYGARDADRAAGYVAHDLWRDEPLRWPLLHRAIGGVALWGTVVECEDGWRASRAYPQRIYLPKRGQGDDAVAQSRELAAGLSSYGVPVELIDCDLTSGDGVLLALEARASAHTTG
jgi:hypothetical protein